MAFLTDLIKKGRQSNTDAWATLSDSTRARHPPNHLNQVSYSTPYNHLVLSRARRYSGTATHRLAEQKKSSGKITDGWMFRLVTLGEPINELIMVMIIDGEVK